MWTEPILHVDMDSFFVEVERLGQPDLKERPVAVGGTGSRGVIASASYEARARGVRSAQPTAVALRLCPELVVVAPSHRRYGEISDRVFAIFRSFTPDVEELSVDEAFLDVGSLRRHYDSPLDVAIAIRARMRRDLALPASVGIAATKFVAKLASAAAKPDGYLHVPLDSQLDFLHALPVQSLWGVGPATLAAMERLGVVTVGDLAELPEPSVVGALGSAQGRHLMELARGRDPRSVQPDSESKSISVEQTYGEDLHDRELIEACLLGHAQRLSGRLRRAALGARTVTLKIRYDDFTTLTRSTTSDAPIDSARDLFLLSQSLLDLVEAGRPVRLLGLAGSSLEMSRSPRQMTFESDENWERVADAVAGVLERYGEGAIEPARLLEGKIQEPESSA